MCRPSRPIDKEATIFPFEIVNRGYTRYNLPFRASFLQHVSLKDYGRQMNHTWPLPFESESKFSLYHHKGTHWKVLSNRYK